MAQRVLVVDDDRTVADVVCRYLEHAGYEVAHVGDGAEALAAVARRPPHLVVLDLMLPVLDGLEVCRRLRQRPDGVPIVMLTARGDEADRVLGLQLGADDYLSKPFSPRELVLRVRSVLRRAGGDPAGAPPPELLADDGLEVATGPRVARLHGRELTLTLREFDLLVHLMRHPARAFRRAELLERVWGWSFGDQSTVTVHVRRLREKIEADPADPRRIVTVWGVGYRYEPARA
ncbi:response regulator transcription factor [Micromonospora chaiyaphumensis]|uniref:DNA-binding response regulator, OmpR family, contains REC and winged-helix (WHTH) domain n=1 Tax=Micromonospora chaiyaphumensis TaxID=307119 RepID=A0A1C4URE2_9ACTN|nr:response regulator transcription factor [Micromonospora chaiyaphumensis]SCE74299.1 DNA-binding response regulator, OmpR family, contains REC and winged-helix (wHTH) domain [Micromonospora chaiyaphumensis]